MAEARGARRPPHVDLPNTPYFVSSRTHEPRRLFVGADAAAAYSELHAIREQYGFFLLAFAFMPDHAHFVIVPAADSTTSRTMQLIKGRIARRINDLLGEEGTIWQQGFYDKVVRTREQLNAFIEYTHRNPVEAGLIQRDEQYAFSSADGSCMVDYRRFFDEARV